MTIFVADFGGNGWTVYDSQNDRTFPLSIEDFFTLDWLRPGSILIAEKAHLGSPRNDYSLAQVYVEHQLLDLYARAEQKGCRIKLFPHMLTAKARARFGNGCKTDAEDVKAIYGMVTNCPYMPLMNPPKTFVVSNAREAGWAFKHETNGILNKARRFKYEATDDAVVQFLDANLHRIAARLSPAAREVFSLDKTKRDGSFYASDARRSRMYTFASLFINPNGYARCRQDTGRIPGVKWLKRYVLHESPFHFRGGIARSNVAWHNFRNYAIKKMDTRKASTNGKTLSHYDFTPEQDAEFRRLRREFNNATTELMQVVRDLVKSEGLPLETALS